MMKPIWSIVKWGSVFTLLLSPIWSRFVDAWLEQNDIFSDPNSTLQTTVATLFNILSSPIFAAIIIFVAGWIIGLLVTPNWPRAISFLRGTGFHTRSERTAKIVEAIEKIVSDYDENLEGGDHENAAAEFMRERHSSLRSFNVTLSKLGFKPIDFMMHNHVELDFLLHILNETKPLLSDGHADEANKELDEILKKANYTLDRWDRDRPVRWIIEDDGSLYCPNHDYPIEASRLHEDYETNGEDVYSWPEHMAGKTWVELGVFLDAYKRALTDSDEGIDMEKYQRSVRDAQRRR